MMLPRDGTGYNGPRMIAPPGSHHGPPLSNGAPRHRADWNGRNGERMSIRSRQFGYMPGPSPTPSPRDGPGLTPRHASFNYQQQQNGGGGHSYQQRDKYPHSSSSSSS